MKACFTCKVAPGLPYNHENWPHLPLSLTISRFIDIAPPNVYVTPGNITALENSSIVLSCNCGCSIRPHWFNNNQLIHFNVSQSPYTLLSNGSLHINISRYTAGHYSCEIRTHYWSVRSEQVKLEVWCKYTSKVFLNCLTEHRTFSLQSCRAIRGSK